MIVNIRDISQDILEAIIKTYIHTYMYRGIITSIVCSVMSCASSRLLPPGEALHHGVAPPAAADQRQLPGRHPERLGGPAAAVKRTATLHLCHLKHTHTHTRASIIKLGPDQLLTARYSRLNVHEDCTGVHWKPFMSFNFYLFTSTETMFESPFFKSAKRIGFLSHY